MTTDPFRNNNYNYNYNNRLHKNDGHVFSNKLGALLGFSTE
jgi:hypothetical protein